MIHYLIIGYKIIFKGCTSLVKIITERYARETILSITYINTKKNTEIVVEEEKTKQED